MGPSDSLYGFFEETEFDETHMAGGASPEDIFSILESLENIEEFLPVIPMADPGLGPKEGEETVKKRLVSQRSSSSSALAQESETDQPEASPKSKRQKITAAATSSEEALTNPDGSQRTSHITVERNRRKQMNEHLAVLRSLMPCFYVKRGDQASIIGGVVDYISELQQVLHSLEAKKQRKVYSEILSPRIVSSPRPSPLSPRKPPLSPRLINLPISPRTPQPNSPYNIPRLHQTPPPPPPSSSFPSSSSSSSSSSPSSTSAIDNANELAANSKSGVAEVEVKFSGANVLLKTISRRIPGQAVKIVSALEDLSLEILDLSINTVDETMLNSFTIKIGIECQLSAEELAHQIQQTFC